MYSPASNTDASGIGRRLSISIEIAVTNPSIDSRRASSTESPTKLNMVQESLWNHDRGKPTIYRLWILFHRAKS